MQANRHTLADLVCDVILLFSREGRAIAGNTAATERLGREAVGLEIADLFFGSEAIEIVRKAIVHGGLDTVDLEAPLAGAGGPIGYLWRISRNPTGIAMCGREIDRIYGLDLIQHLSEGISERQSRLEVASSINRALVRTLDVEKIDQVIATRAPGLVEADFLQFAVADTAPELCDLKILSAGAETLLSAQSRPWASLSAERSFHERKPRVHRGQVASADPLRSLGAKSAMDLPVVLDDQVLGVLTFASRAEDAYSEQSVLAVEPIVGQYAIALANARVVRSLCESNRVKQEIIEIASHEFNTPLTVIMGFASMLAEDTGTLAAGQVSDAIRMIDVEAERLRRLIDELLTVSRIDAGRMELFVCKVDLAVLVRDACAALEVAYPGRKVTIAGPASAVMQQDSNKITRCLTNLVSNALKFSPADSVVEVNLTTTGQAWEVSVFNIDQGISAAEAAQLFEKFHRLERHKNHSEGSGLGLYMTRRLAQRLGGDVRIVSQPTRGTTFVLALPDLAEQAQGPTATELLSG